MSIKAKVIATYFAIGLLYAIYLSVWGPNSYRGFFYNLGLGLIWPLVMFPGLGKVVGAIILLVFIALVLIS